MFAFLIIVFVLLLAYRKYSRLRFERLINEFPGPRGYPVVGNISVLSHPENLFKQFRHFAKEYSSFRLWFLHVPMITIGTAEDAQEMFTSLTNIYKAEFYHFVRIVLGGGLISTNNIGQWRERRKLLTPTFHFSILRKFMITIAEKSEELVETIQHECTKSKTDINALLSEITLNVICATAMGVSLRSDNDSHKHYRKTINDGCAVSTELMSSPWLISEWLMKYTPWIYRELIIKNTRAGNRLYKYAEEIRHFVKEIIKERETYLLTADEGNTDVENEKCGNKRHFALLDLLLKEKKLGHIDTEGVVDEINTFMSAGYETTAKALTFILMYLSNEKEIQDKIVEELLDVLKDNREITMEDLQQMNYLERCIKECLRLYPSAPLVARKLVRDMYIGKHLAPAGTNILISIYDIHRDPKYFPDPEVFNPDRFLPENEKLLHPFAFVPFSAGPRNCIGKRFAMLEIKTMVASVLLKYELESVQKSEDITFLNSITLQSKDPIYVKFNHRQFNN